MMNVHHYTRIRMRQLLKFTPVLCLICMGCAGIVPPSGGPVDTVPPTIINTVPAQNATDVHPAAILLEFSKYVDRSSVQEAIFISPRVGSMEFSWSGTEVEITFSDSLRSNTTYVVNVGTDVVDINNRNRMAQAYTLAFSTGDSIDHGIITGKVMDPKPEGILMFAYRLDSIRADTLNPAHTSPDFITQTGKGGAFSLQNIPDGSYRVIAVRDEYRNYLYDSGVDDFGIPFRNIRLGQQTRLISDLLFQMSREDTAHLALLSALSRDNDHVMLRFSKAIRGVDVHTEAFKIVDSLTHDTVGVQDWYSQPQQRSSLILVTDTLRAGARYGVEVFSLHAQTGDSLSAPQRNIYFDSPSGRDTLRPRIQLFTPGDSVRDVPFSQSIELQFDDAVRRDSLENGFVLLDSTRKKVEGVFYWLHSAGMTYRPVNPMRSAEWYTSELRGKSVVDYAGNALRDSVVRRHFRTIDAASLSQISGIVVDTTHEDGAIVVLATEAGGTKPPYIAVADTTGAFTVQNLPEGKYTLQAFRDRDNSRTYSNGKPYPYMPAARFAIYPDTVKLRARWPLEGMKIQMK